MELPNNLFVAVNGKNIKLYFEYDDALAEIKRLNQQNYTDVWFDSLERKIDGTYESGLPF